MTSSTQHRSAREELFDQLAALFEASGVVVDDAMRRDFEPLLNGEMTLEEHRQFLAKKYGV